MIKLKIKELFTTFKVLTDLIQINEQPFHGQAKILTYKIQDEITYLQKAELTEEDIKAIQEEEIEFGSFITVPVNYSPEYVWVLEKVCGELPEKEVASKAIVEKLTKTKDKPKKK